MSKFVYGTQNRDLLTRMKKGKKVTRLTALYTYGIQNVTARIADLRNAGYCVNARIRKDENGATYAEYFITCLPCLNEQPTFSRTATARLRVK